MIELEETLGVSSAFLESCTWKRTPEVKGCILVAEPAFQSHSSTPQALAHALCSLELTWCFPVSEDPWSIMKSGFSFSPCSILSVWELCLLRSEVMFSDRGGKNGLVIPTLGWINKRHSTSRLRTQLFQGDWNGKHSLLASDLIL